MKKVPFEERNDPYDFVQETLVFKSLKSTNIPSQTAAALSDVIIDSLDTYVAVQSLDAISAINSLLEEKLKAGCDDTKCIIEVAGAMDISQVVTGQIVKLGDRYMISLMLIQTKGDNLGLIKRSAKKCECTEGELVDVAKKAALELIGVIR